MSAVCLGLSAACWLAGAWHPAGSARAASPADAALSVSSGATVSDLYKAERLRDPFVELGGSGGRSVPAPVSGEEAAEFSIHSLLLRSMMQDRSGHFAALTDKATGASYVLKKGRLYDYRNKPVHGVMGEIQFKRKRVQLTTPDKDVQILILGEEEGL